MKFTQAILIFSLLLTGGRPSFAQDEQIYEDALPPQTLVTIEKGLAALARMQNPDGSFERSVPVANTALAGLAFLAGGHVPGRSKYGHVVTKAARYLIRQQNAAGYINEPSGTAQQVYLDHSINSGMYGQGYAVLFLSQLYGHGLNDDEEIRDAVVKGIKFIELAQSDPGGWLYAPRQGDEGSVTVTQVQALRSARDAGFSVREQTIQRAIAYMEKSTNEEGRTVYSLTGNMSRYPSISAASICVFDSLGIHKNPKVAKGLDWLLAEYKPDTEKNKSSIKGNWSGNHWYFYGNFYATLAMYKMGGKYWKEWAPLMRKSFTDSQAEDGRWLVAESERWGPTLGTSFALLTLQIPLKYLPIFQR